MINTMVATALLNKVREKQAKDGLSDHKFADKLGVSYQLWQMTRTGNREIGLTTLRGIVKAYPELHRDVLIFLGADVDIKTVAEHARTTPYQSFCSQVLRGFRGWAKGIYTPDFRK